MTSPYSVVIAGASSGFGAALAHDLAATGHQVVAGARRPRPDALRMRYVPVDLTDGEATARFAQGATEHLGQVDGLVYCAADPGAVGRAWQLDADTFARVLNVSLLGFVRLAGHLVPHMQQAGGGSIIAVGSQAARTPVDLLAAYGAAKAALEQYARCLAEELSGTGIRVNTLGIAAETELAATHRAAKAALRGRPSPHPPLPAVADSLPLARWLLSTEARHVTGQTLEARRP
ncbi:SDR family oxidoreductase [Streptomyces sp. NBC_00133]|uniref:SDR family NAD(P)-dependent oxidoreductase n=1 Tax=Streptomyces sp. NBC_00133 TaxID=2903624 RepID=UPI00324A96EC